MFQQRRWHKPLLQGIRRPGRCFTFPVSACYLNVNHSWNPDLHGNRCCFLISTASLLQSYFFPHSLLQVTVTHGASSHGATVEHSEASPRCFWCGPRSHRGSSTGSKFSNMTVLSHKTGKETDTCTLNREVKHAYRVHVIYFSLFVLCVCVANGGCVCFRVRRSGGLSVNGGPAYGKLSFMSTATVVPPPRSIILKTADVNGHLPATFNHQPFDYS